MHNHPRRQGAEAGPQRFRPLEARSAQVMEMMKSDKLLSVLRTIRWQMPVATSAPAQEGIARFLSKHILQSHPVMQFLVQHRRHPHRRRRQCDFNLINHGYIQIQAMVQPPAQRRTRRGAAVPMSRW